VIDDNGEETCLSPLGKMIYCAPISMIQKRVRRNEALDIEVLVEETIRTVAAREQSGEYSSR
jgi:hypothetical protein